MPLAKKTGQLLRTQLRTEIQQLRAPRPSCNDAMHAAVTQTAAARAVKVPNCLPPRDAITFIASHAGVPRSTIAREAAQAFEAARAGKPT